MAKQPNMTMATTKQDWKSPGLAAAFEMEDKVRSLRDISELLFCVVSDLEADNEDPRACAINRLALILSDTYGDIEDGRRKIIAELHPNKKRKGEHDG